MTADEKTVILSDEVVLALKKRVESSDFNSVSDYVNYILKQVLDNAAKKEEEKSKDEEEVKSKLKALGYV